jgi:hypothetical protein
LPYCRICTPCWNGDRRQHLSSWTELCRAEDGAVKKARLANVQNSTRYVWLFSEIA